MIKKIKQLITGALALALFATPVLVPVAAHAATSLCGADQSISGCVNGGVQKTDPNSGVTGDTAVTKVTGLATDIIKIFSYVVGIVSVIMVIVGGFQYVTSGGDSGKVTTAKNTIMYALIGIVIVALSQIMVNFVLAKFV